MDENITTCPFCKEDIKVGAIKCKHCGERLDGATTTAATANAATSDAAPAASIAPTPPPSLTPAAATAAVHTPTEARPAAPEIAPITPKPFSVAIGIALVVLAAWLLFSWIPSKKPLSPEEAAAFIAAGGSPKEWRLASSVYPWAYAIAALLGLAGITRAVHGLTYRKPAPKARR